MFYFQQMFQTVLDERKKREVDPTLAVLRDCLEKKGSPHELKRIKAMLGFTRSSRAPEQDPRLP